MNKNNNSGGSSVGGISFGSLLTLVFIVLKLTGVINWSWVWVLSPLWISAILILILVIVLHIIYRKM
jgi:hypothetical protein